jgi:biopolymer transport protein TolR
MAEINVTPLVDVMLVLLIIFMVTAPMLTQGVDVNLPKASSKALRGDEDRLIITVDANSRVFVGKQPVEFNRLEGVLREIVARRTDRQVFFRADRAVPYGFVVKVIAEVRNSGIEKLGMVTEPLER